MLEVYDRERRLTAILENALNIREEERINAVGSLSFSLPYNDPKNKYCLPFCYARWNGGQLHRILPSTLSLDESGVISYTCEHVLATLMDSVLHGAHVVGNTGTHTPEVIRYVLDRQITRQWELVDCDFSRQFEYGWENETLLSALFSIPNCFSEPFLWVTDTSVFPWRLSLKRLDENGKPDLYVRPGKNLLSLTRTSNPQDLCTRLYPLGYGEGVNQLTIKGVNGGKEYLESPPEIVAKYGIIERVWIDRRYEDAASLKAAGEAMLKELQEPAKEYSFTFAELGGEAGRAAVGKRARLECPEAGILENTYITGVTRGENPDDSSLTIANRPKDIASSVADMADRQRVEMSYSQGATNLYAQSLQANADASYGAEMHFFIPQEMRIVNKVLAKVRLSQFRAYSKATEGGGAASTTSDSGGGGSATSDSGGGYYGGGTQSSTEPNSYISIDNYTGQPVWLNNQWGQMASHVHEFPGMPDHTHNFYIPSISIPNHSHRVSIPAHSHPFRIPAHSHNITPGIYFFGGSSAFSLYVNGVRKADFSSTGEEIDVTPHLIRDGSIPRGSWQSIEIRPNGLAYVCIDLMVQGFIQSRGDRTV